MTLSHYQITTILGLIFLFVAGRTVPHLANLAPCIALAVLAGQTSHRKTAYFTVFIALMLSDTLIYLFIGPYQLGSWCLFTYSGFLMVAALGLYYTQSNAIVQSTGITLLACVIYWLWTNFGTWLFSGMYPHDVTGLFNCYILALPFLKNSMAANIIWSIPLFTLSKFITQHRNKKTREGLTAISG